jgi:hypothetical protein
MAGSPAPTSTPPADTAKMAAESGARARFTRSNRCSPSRTDRYEFDTSTAGTARPSNARITAPSNCSAASATSRAATGADSSQSRLPVAAPSTAWTVTTVVASRRTRPPSPSHAASDTRFVAALPSPRSNTPT